MIQGANHYTLAVSQLDVSFAFYRDVLKLTPLARWETGAYFLAGDFWLCLTLDPSTRKEPLPEYTHLALTVAPENFEQASRRIRDSGAVIWKENTSEGDSLYFLDSDGHKLEIHASDWRARLDAWKADPWDGLEFF